MLIVIKAEKFGDYKLNSYLCEVKIKVRSLVVWGHFNFTKGHHLPYLRDVFFCVFIIFSSAISFLLIYKFPYLDSCYLSPYRKSQSGWRSQHLFCLTNFLY